MASTIYVCPREGLVVRDPVTYRPLPPEGATKPRNSFWLRRISDGDVFECSPPAPDPE